MEVVNLGRVADETPAVDLSDSLRFNLPGHEELGDGGLEEFVPRHADLLRADVILICDTGNAAVGVPTLTTTLRGVVEVTVTVRSLSTAMHSGMVGGAAPDALAAMILMLASMRDEQGNTTIQGGWTTRRSGEVPPIRPGIPQGCPRARRRRPAR